MDRHVFDAFSRRAAEALDRRSVLGVLSGAALAALNPFAADAKKGKGKGKGKKKGKKKGKNKAPCKPFGNQCRNAALDFCNLLWPGDENLDDFFICRGVFFNCCSIEDRCKREIAQECFAEAQIAESNRKAQQES